MQTFSDQPHEHNDELRRAPLAKRVASLLSLSDTSRDLVVSVEGTWGSGKSAFFNQTKTALNEVLPKDEIHLVIDFNLWLLSDRNAIVQALLGRILSSISAIETFKDVVRPLKKYLSGLKVLKIIPGSEPLHGAIDAIADNDTDNTPNLDELKLKVEAALKDSKQRIFVFVDDLDRVTPEEFYEIVRAVKAVANFPYVTYMLAYDPEVAIHSLSSFGIAKDQSYLDKIVQLRVTIPPPAADSLETIFLAAWSSLPAEFLQAEANHKIEERIRDFWREALWQIFQTPRDIKRVFNRFMLRDASNLAEVNTAEIFALTVI
jgi:predicted KAP-like P-loop ATPase